MRFLRDSLVLVLVFFGLALNSCVAGDEIISHKINNIYYVDGVTYAKSSTGIQSIIDSISSGGAATIVCPPGNYDFTSTVDCDDKRISFIGQNRASNGTYFYKNSSWSSGAMISVTNISPGGGCEISNIFLNGNNEVGDGISISGVCNLTLEKLVIHNCNGDTSNAGIRIDSSSTNPSGNIHLSDIYTQNNSINIVVENNNEGTSQWTNAIWLSDSWINYPNGDNGICIQVNDNAGSNTSFQIDNVYIEGASGETGHTGLDMNDTSATICNDVHFDFNPSANAVDFTDNTGTNASMFTGCFIAGEFVDHSTKPAIRFNQDGELIIGNIKIHLTDTNFPTIEGAWTLTLDGNTGDLILKGSSIRFEKSIVLGRYNNANYDFKHYGVISGSGNKYVRYVINDSTDNYELSRENDSIDNFDIQMPVIANSLLANDYYSGDGTQGITQSETNVTSFDIEIKDGLITSFIKN